MKKRLFLLFASLVLVFTIAGCSEVNVNIYDDGAVGEDRDQEDLLKELDEENSYDALVGKYGRVSYDLSARRKDGTADDYTVYVDEERYVQDDDHKILIIEDGEVYGYDKDNRGPMRYLFPGNYDEFMCEPQYHSMYGLSENEEITSREDKDGYIYLESVMPADSAAHIYTSFGYSKDDADSVSTEYVIDAETMEILECNSYLVKGDKKIWYSGQVLKRECDEYIPDPEIVDGVFGDDIRKLTLITDAGTDHEQEYTQTVTKGSLFRVYFGEEFCQAVYSDAECLTRSGKIDRSLDATLYLKRKVDYSNEDNWAYYDLGDDKDADLFLICPPVDVRDEFNMSMDDEETRESFLGALNMERGIYEDNTRMFAPYYRQAAMKVYSMEPKDREPYFIYAYDDIAEAFYYYLENENHGRPIVLAGFSQGADMCYRLLKDFFTDEELQDRLVAVYAIGWPCSEEMVEKFPQIKPAAAEDDTGVVVSFECEAGDVTDTFILPEGTRAYTINPLNWKTDGTPADKSENLGACFTDYDGNIVKEEKGLCGGYIDEERCALKVTDIDPEDYPAIIPMLPKGAYHIYDYQFFYRNLEENVGRRIESFTGPATDDGRPWMDSDIKSNVTDDTRTDPRDDFHLYVNKEWILENEIPAGYRSWAPSTERSTKVKEQCMELLSDDSIEGHDAELVRTYNRLLLDWDAREKVGVSEIEDIYKRILNIKNTDDLDELLTDKDCINEFSHLISYTAGVGYIDPGEYIVSVRTPDLLLNDSAEYINRTGDGEIYYGMRKDIFVHIACRMGMSEAEAGKCFDDAISFETRLAGNIYSTQETMQPDYFDKIYNEMTFDELSGLSSSYPLRQILEAAGYDYGGTYVVLRPDYFGKLDEVYTDDNIDEIKAYLLVDYLRGYAGSLDKDIYDYVSECKNRYLGSTGEAPYEEVAYNAVVSGLPASMQKVYIARYGSGEDKKRVEDLCDEIIRTYREMLADNDWASDEVKENAIKKLDNMTVNVAYPEKLSDTTGLDLKDCSLVEAKRRISEFEAEYKRNLIGKKTDDSTWAEIGDILSCNAFYVSFYNSINIPIGVMGDPFYSKDMSTEELYASMGAFMIGHEISHAFDKKGSQVDENGSFRNWWTEEDRAEYDKRLKKMDDYLDQITAFGDEHLIGSNIDEEMTADITGMQCILRMASKVKNFDYDKFFTQYAKLRAGIGTYDSELVDLKQEVHPLDYVRTNVVVQQFDEFYETYGVKEGDNMYLAPEDRITIW